MIEKIEKAKVLLKSLGMSKALSTLEQESSFLLLEKNAPYKNLREKSEPSSLKSADFLDVQSANPFNSGEENNDLSKNQCILAPDNVFSEENCSNPFKGSYEIDDESSNYLPLNRDLSGEDNTRIQHYSIQAQEYERSDSSLASPNLSENIVSKNYRPKRLEIAKTSINKSKIKSDFSHSQIKGNFIDNQFFIDRNQSANLERKDISGDEVNNSDSENQLQQFSFCETPQEGESATEKTPPHFLSNLKNDHSDNKIIYEKNTDTKKSSFHINIDNSKTKLNHLNITPLPQRSNQGTLRVAQETSIARSSYISQKVDSSSINSVKSSKSETSFKITFEDAFLQIYSISEIELKLFMEFIKTKHPHVFSSHQGTGNIPWENFSRGSKDQTLSQMVRKKPDVRVKVFIAKEHKKNVLRDKYEVRKELHKSNYSEVLYVI